jgi:hypothetical protein
VSATPTRQDLPQFALELARARAKSLARQKRLPAHEREDIEQHFLVEVWRRWHRLDEKRGRLAAVLREPHRTQFREVARARNRSTGLSRPHAE